MWKCKVVVLVGLATAWQSQLCEAADPPPDHTIEVAIRAPWIHRGIIGSCSYCHNIHGGGLIPEFFLHPPGYGLPYDNGCTDCHGSQLDGTDGTAYSCYSCHDRIWSGEGPPVDHTERKGGFADHKPGYGDPYTNCTQCHGEALNDGFAPSCFLCHGAGGDGAPGDHTNNRNGVFHKPGGLFPFDNGCTLCHGSQLQGGFAPSCLNCHGPDNAPADHTGVLNGFAAHRPGLENPFDAGCSNCHGSTLDNGPAVSCVICHGPRWNPHDFRQEPWLPAGENYCNVCHRGPEWNHLTSSSTYTVTSTTMAQVGQPGGKSAKCLDCHEGEPTGRAVDDFGGRTGGVYFVDGEEAFGTDLTHHHPVSFIYDAALATAHQGLHDPTASPSTRTETGTIEQDMLEAGQLQCTSCHDQHDNSKGNYLYETLEEGHCFICHKRDDPPFSQHHIPGRDDPWGVARGTDFNCTMCHGPLLEGNSDWVPACTDCHNPFDFPNAPVPGHHGLPQRDDPLGDGQCYRCHGDPVTGELTGTRFGDIKTPSCGKCHTNRWPVSDPGLKVAYTGPAASLAGAAVELTAKVTYPGVNDAYTGKIIYHWWFGDDSQSAFPVSIMANQPVIARHTYVEPGTYTGYVSVTDGTTPPVVTPFSIEVTEPPSLLVPDTWSVIEDINGDGQSNDPTDVLFDITFKSADAIGGTVLTAVKLQNDTTTLGMGMELPGVIYWFDMEVTLQNWRIGCVYYANIDRELGWMSGIVITPRGGIHPFKASQ